MKTILVASLLLPPQAETGVGDESETPPLRYEIDLEEPGDDLFHVTFRPGPLSEEDRFLDFVAFAPGVHSVLDFGRFVQVLAAFDAEGNLLGVERRGTNRWELLEPARVDRIVYDIEDTFDSELEEHRVLACAGTGIEDDYVLLNTFGVLAYLEGHLARPVELVVSHDPDWVVGTALRKGRDGAYRAPSYRELVDSPFLMGDLSTVGIRVGEIDVDIFVHSRMPSLDAEEVLFVAGDVLEAAEDFIGFAPVDRYVFLMEFMDQETVTRNRIRSMGALEHSYSSMYTLAVMQGSLGGLAQTIAHEFMHILTPLHLKSEVIASFDYSIPTTDRFLWLYEGVTEWAADMLMVRGGVTDLERHLDVLGGKIQRARMFDEAYGLGRLSLEWSTPEGLRQYGNIYQLGALTAAMLDLRLLELSGGERGLRDVFFEFVERYGKQEPFDEATFLDELVAATYPEVGDFMARHVEDNEPLPYAELFSKVGIDYDGAARLTPREDCTPEELALREAWVGRLSAD